jgi:hypothetical protein
MVSNDAERTKPALTPAEWAGRCAQLTGSDDECTVALSGGDLWIHDGPRDAVLGESSSLHALAALALDGQHFGFTWADVDVLLAEAERLHRVERHLNTPTAEARAAVPGRRLRDLAERIAALLPPRP